METIGLAIVTASLVVVTALDGSRSDQDDIWTRRARIVLGVVNSIFLTATLVSAFI